MMRPFFNQPWMQFLLVGWLCWPGFVINAQEKKLPTPANRPAGNDVSVDIASVQILSALTGGGVPRAGASGGAQRIAVQWNVVVPDDIKLEGFEVAVTAKLSNGQSLNQQQSFGSNTRRADFNFNLPNANTGGANPGDIKEPDGKTQVPPTPDCKAKCSRLGGTKRQACLDECQKGTPAPEVINPIKKNFLSSNAPVGLGNSLVAPQVKEKGFGSQSQIIVISTATATVTARFSRSTDAFALRDFAPPAANATGELAVPPPPNNRHQTQNLKILRLIEILKVPSKAKDCPADHDCFDILAEARSNGGSFKVNLEALYPNNQRVNVPQFTVNTLAQPVRVKVKRPGAAAFVLVTPRLNGTLTESFTRTDSDTNKQQVLEILEQTNKK